MKDYERQVLRDVGLFAHGGAGKTSVAEAMLFCAGVTTRLGLVSEGTSVLDFAPEAKNRVSSISLAVTGLEWEKHKINLVDTPGDMNFVADARAALRAVDAAVFVVDAVDGVKVITGKLWGEAKELGLPRILFVNKLDRERADFEATLESIKTSLEVAPCPLTIPLGEQDKLQGVVDLVRMKALMYEKDGSGKYKEGEIPKDAADEVAEYREKMVEAIAESNDALDSHLAVASPLADSLRCLRFTPARLNREAGEARQCNRGLKKMWCAREDLNLHPFRDQILSLARLPFRHVRDLDQEQLGLSPDTNA